MSKTIFVFGSNLRGIHGAGAALYAVKYHGAIRGQGFGPQGDSFAIPTKSNPYTTLPLDIIEDYVSMFLVYVSRHSGLIFYLTAIGCGLAGYKVEEIAPMFMGAPRNIYLPDRFIKEMYPVELDPQLRNQIGGWDKGMDFNA